MNGSTEQKPKRRRWTEIAQLVSDYRGWSVYDDPFKAMMLGTIDSHSGYDAWKAWMHEHYVGAAGYDHETGKITHPKLREFFDRHYPDFGEQQRKREKQQNER